MEETPTRIHKMGKYSQGFCRRCSLSKASNNQHVTAMRNAKDTSERRHSGAHNWAGQIMRQERAKQEETIVPVYNAGRSTTECRIGGHESRVKRGNYSCEHRPTGSIHTAGKEYPYRGKGRISRGLAVEKRMGLLTRSTSCGDVCYLRYKDNETSSDTSSGAENESAAVFTRDNYTSTGICFECEDENILGNHRGLDSMPNLNGINKESAKGNQLGLEVMLSLINGPMQSVIDSKDEKIRTLEHAVERLECENKQTKYEQKSEDATKMFTLEKTLEGCVKQIEQLDESKKTDHEKIRLLEDLRKNDKECIDILRQQTNELEAKLAKSDERVREVEKEGKSQSQRSKQQYEKRMEELEKALRSKESKLRDYDKIKSRVVKQKQELEDRKNNENEMHAKTCEQVLDLKRDLQLQQTKLSILEREKKALEESLSQSENLQRQDQKSSYVLQMKIVELQEKLEGSYRKNEELSNQLETSNTRGQLLEDRLRQASKSLNRWGERMSKDNQGIGSEANHKTNPDNGNALERRSEENPENPGRRSLVFNRHVNDVLREKVVELHSLKFYKGQQGICNGERSSSDEHIENLNCDEESGQEKWRTRGEYKTQASSNFEENQPVRDVPSRKVEMVLTGDKRRPCSEDSSSNSSSASSSRRGSSESPRAERRQLKVLKVRKVSKENITQFQQNAAYIMSLGRHQALKDVREDPCGSAATLNTNTSRLLTPIVSPRPSKDHTFKT